LKQKVRTKSHNFYRDFSKFKKSYKPRTNIVKGETSDLFAYSHRTLNIRRNKSSFVARSFCDVRQTEIHTAEVLVPEPSAFEVEMAI
jgi:hypothetical protein